MNSGRSHRRIPYQAPPGSPEQTLALARSLAAGGKLPDAFDTYGALALAHPGSAVRLLAELYEIYHALPQRDRYTLYQARLFSFDIQAGESVLDVGSGHLPFPLATVLADITLTDHAFGRAGAPFKVVEGRNVFECSVEHMPFEDKSFDFVYCSHVLEHVDDPVRACGELMRVGKRGYLETPTRGKDVFLSTAKISNHRWSVEALDGRLVFTEYLPEDLEGLETDILMSMHTSPETEREKAFSASLYLHADTVNTMFPWNDKFEVEVRRRKTSVRVAGVRDVRQKEVPRADTSADDSPSGELTFLQVHTFYDTYLVDFYARHPQATGAPFAEQINMLVRDGFSAVHLFAPYLRELAYDPFLVIGNNPASQTQWLAENGLTPPRGGNWVKEVVRFQVETIRPEILYLTDPITYDGKFLASLQHRPAAVLGWRAANIPRGTDWHGFDLILSSLEGIRAAARELGASSAAHFFPGFPQWMNVATSGTVVEDDVVFVGQWTQGQHQRRNQLLEHVARASASEGFHCALYLSGEVGKLPPAVAAVHRAPVYGVEMQRALRKGKIALDARGTIGLTGENQSFDLAGTQTANMRIFEVTGSGVFLLAEHHDNIGEYFVAGKEIETYRNEQELIDKIHYYLAHPEQREAIARKGQERCASEYAMERRAQELDRHIRGCLHRGMKPPTPVPSANAFTQGKDALERGDYETAFARLHEAKALRVRMRDLDLMRSLVFRAQGSNHEAVEALHEELRLFPDNDRAMALLAELQTLQPRVAAQLGDPGFRELLEIVRPFTMLSEERLFSLYTLGRTACEKNIPGNFVECGVAGGGSSALLATVLKRFSKVPRSLFAFDSFEGMPDPTPEDRADGRPANATGWGAGTCSAPLVSLQSLAHRLGVADLIVPVQGLFQTTLSAKRDMAGMIAFLHLDGDWYESTKVILDQLYDRVSDGGLLQFDDYGHWEGCRQAVTEFAERRGITFDLREIDYTGRWCPKPETFALNATLAPELIEDFKGVDPAAAGLDSQMSRNERFQLYYAARVLARNDTGSARFVEIGSYAGASLILEYAGLRQNFSKVQGIAIEPARHPQLDKVMEMLGGDVKQLCEFSTTAHKKLRDIISRDGIHPLLLTIDGDHTYEGVKSDIEKFVPLVAPGGLVVFHDVLPPLDALNREAICAHHNNTEPGVRRAVEEVAVGQFHLVPLDLPLLAPEDPTQTQAHLPVIPGVFSTLRVFQKPVNGD